MVRPESAPQPTRTVRSAASPAPSAKSGCTGLLAGKAGQAPKLSTQRALAEVQ